MDVYLMEVSPLLQSETLASTLPFLSPDRREALGRLQKPDDRARSAGAGLLLRHALKGAGVAAEQAQISVGAHGKPYLPGHPGIHFSLSHAGCWAACAMDKSPVGVDLEEVGPARLPVARRSFAADEYAYLQGLGGRERDLFFTALWTAKESVLKWAGDGLAGGLAAVSVEHRHLRPATARYRQTRLRLQSLLPRPGVVLTAATAQDSSDFRLTVVPFENIL